MAAISHIENYLFNGLTYSAAQYMFFGLILVKEFISDVVLMIWPIFDLQIQDGHYFSAQKGQFFKFVIEPDHYTSIILRMGDLFLLLRVQDTGIGYRLALQLQWMYS